MGPELDDPKENTNKFDEFIGSKKKKNIKNKRRRKEKKCAAWKSRWLNNVWANLNISMKCAGIWFGFRNLNLGFSKLESITQNFHTHKHKHKHTLAWGDIEYYWFFSEPPIRICYKMITNNQTKLKGYQQFRFAKQYFSVHLNQDIPQTIFTETFYFHNYYRKLFLFCFLHCSYGADIINIRCNMLASCFIFSFVLLLCLPCFRAIFHWMFWYQFSHCCHCLSVLSFGRKVWVRFVTTHAI